MSQARILWSLAGLLSAALIALFAATGLSACGEEECLVRGENCTQQYKEDNYGTTDIQCCEGTCEDRGSGILTCG